MPNKATKRKVTKKSAAKKVVRKTTRKPANKKALAASTKRQYSKTERTVLIVVYSAFASVFILFANEGDSARVWYYIFAFVCLAMVMRHVAGVLKTYAEK